jgi:hypothetical protein
MEQTKFQDLWPDLARLPEIKPSGVEAGLDAIYLWDGKLPLMQM